MKQKTGVIIPLGIMLGLTLSIFLALLQAPQTGAIVGVVKLPNADKAAPAARVALLPAKYTEAWNKQVQQRIDNYWEIYKPEIIARKELIFQLERAAHVEAFAYITSMMRRELGDGSSKFIKDTSPAG